MFGSEILEIGIGLALVFLLFSLILTAARESIEALRKTRAGDLERALQELLQEDKEGKNKDDAAWKDFYNHPLIYPLYRGKQDDSSRSTAQLSGIMGHHIFRREISHWPSWT